MLNRTKLWRIVATAVLWGAAVITEHTITLPMWQLLIIYLVPFVLIGYDVWVEAFEDLAEGEPFNEDMLMCIATLGALLIGFLPGAEPEFAEAVAVMLFFQLGELFEDYAEDRSRDSISQLMDIRPDTAHVVGDDGSLTTVGTEQVTVGKLIMVKPGERIPLDGVVAEGTSSLNTVALTGESMPREVTVGDEVISGCVNEGAPLQVQVTKPYSESTVARIIELVEHAGDHKSRSETFITRFARVYTPVVVIAAALIAVIPPLFSGTFATTFPTWLYRALTFLVVSCPCALVISVPLSFFGGIGGASRKGILIKGANHIDVLAKLDTVVFDKTGTLTHGEFTVTAVHPEQCDERHLLHLAAHVERYSTHPIAVSLRNAYGNETDDCDVTIITEVAGRGIVAQVNGQMVMVGNEAMMNDEGIEWHGCHHTGTIVHVSIDGTYAGHIVIADTIKDHAAEALANLKQMGVKRTIMLTGDRDEVAQEVAHDLHLDEYHAGLLPTDKVRIMEQLLAAHDRNGALAFVGDGINDAPVLARADLGIAMGAMGSDAAIEAADVVLMDDNLSKLAQAVGIARRTLGIARQNVVFAIGVKALVLLLTAAGLATMWMAVFADVGVTVLAVINATRTLK